MNVVMYSTVNGSPELLFAVDVGASSQFQALPSSNTASREINTRPVLGFRNLYAFDPGSYLMNTIGVLRTSSFF